MDDVEFDAQVRRAVEALVARAPDPRPLPADPDLAVLPLTRAETGHRANGGRRSALLGLAAAVALLVGWGVWSSTAGPEPIQTVGDAVVVRHEVVRYEQSFDLTCPDGDPVITGQFDTMVFESWGSPEQGRWRQVVRYPDGSERNLLATDSPWYPTELYTGGEMRGQEVGCSAGDLLLIEPGQASWFYLNPMSDRPNIPGTQEPAVPSYSDLGELVDDAAVGPSGRPVEVWRLVIDGSYGVSGSTGAVREVIEWLVDPATGQVVQQSFSQDYDGLGEVRWTARLDAFDSVTVDPDLFTSEGLTRQNVDPPPVSTATTVQGPVDEPEPRRPVAPGWIEITDRPEVPDGSAPTAAIHDDGLWQVALCREQGGSAEATVLWAEQIDRWNLASTPDIGSCIRSIVKTPYGYFADATPFALWSEDGRAWSRWEIPMTGDEQRSWSMEAWFHRPGSTRVTLLASTPAPGESRTAHLLSTTDGTTWQEEDRTLARIFDNTDLSAVLTTDGGLVALGNSPGGEASPTAAAFNSADGVTWTRTTPMADGFEDKALTDVVETGDGFLAVGGDFFTNGLMATWTSPDGTAWTPGPQPIEAVDPDVAQVTAHDVTVTAQGFLAAGLDYDARRTPAQRPAFWLSSDGVVWTRSDEPLTGPLIPFTFLTDTGGDLAAWPPKGTQTDDPFRLFIPAP